MKTKGSSKAKLTQLSTRTLASGRKRGMSEAEIAEKAMLTKAKRGMADQSEPGEPPSDRVAAELRKLRAEADLKELQAAKERRSLVSLSDVEQVLDAEIRAVKDKFLVLPDRLATRLATITDPRKVRALIRAEISTILDDLSQVTAQSVTVGTGVSAGSESTA